MDANKIKFERAQGPLVYDDGSVEVLFAKQTEPKAIEPPMTARVHTDYSPTSPDDWNTEEKVIPETIEEEPSSSSESVIIVSSSVDSSIEDLKSFVENLSGEILNLEAGEAIKEPLNEEVIEKVAEQHIKELEKMESVILCLGSGIASSMEPSIGESDIIKSEEVKVPVCYFANGGDEDQDMKREQEIDKEALSLVANAVNDVRAKESASIITPKGCCILQ